MAKLCLPLLWPNGLKLTRLLCPWDSPGKNTGVGGHPLPQGTFPRPGWNPGLLLGRKLLYPWATRKAQHTSGQVGEKKREYRLLVSEMTEGTAPRIPWTLHKITKEDYAHEDNLDETDQIPERHSLPKPFQEEIDNLNRKWKWKSLSHVWLFATPWTVWNSPGQNTWAGGHSLLQGSFQPRDWTQGSHTAGRFFTSWVIRETQEYWSG